MNVFPFGFPLKQTPRNGRLNKMEGASPLPGCELRALGGGQEAPGAQRAGGLPEAAGRGADGDAPHAAHPGLRQARSLGRSASGLGALSALGAGSVHGETRGEATKPRRHR